MHGIREFIEILPKSAFCFTYGSSYLKFPTGKEGKPQIDIVLCVEDPLSWHAENMKHNPAHYASHLHYLGPSFIVNSSSQAAGIHYNPYIHHSDLVYKYGVISKLDLVDDLQHWSNFYLAGRLQKPIEIIVENLEIQNLMRENLKKAVIVAGLMTPSLFSEIELYEQIARLSYYGDVRIEHTDKITNMVSGNLHKFYEIYRPIISDLPGLKLEAGMLERNNKFFESIHLLPDWIKCYTELSTIDYTDRTQILVKLFTNLNKSVSLQQIKHAIKTTSPYKIIKYSLAKLSKSLK